MRGLFPDKDLKAALDDETFGKAKQRPSSASPATAPPAIGRTQTCWCGRPFDHDWPSKNDGAPHPRYPD